MMGRCLAVPPQAPAPDVMIPRASGLLKKRTAPTQMLNEKGWDGFL